MLEWSVRVDLQSPDCDSQILMVMSELQLAICFPSGLHATEKTLKLWEVSTRINRNKEEKHEEKTYKFECPVSGHSQTYIFVSFKLSSFSIIHLSNKSTFSSGRSQQHSQQEQDFAGYFPSKLRGKSYPPMWPVSVDWQSPDCASQILIVLSQLPLAICFPSGLHATEGTLKL